MPQSLPPSWNRSLQGCKIIPLKNDISSQAFLLRLKSGRYKNAVMISRQLLLTTMPRVHLRPMSVGVLAFDAGNSGHVDVVHGGPWALGQRGGIRLPAVPLGIVFRTRLLAPRVEENGERGTASDDDGWSH